MGGNFLHYSASVLSSVTPTLRAAATCAVAHIAAVRCTGAVSKKQDEGDSQTLSLKRLERPYRFLQDGGADLMMWAYGCSAMAERGF